MKPTKMKIIAFGIVAEIIRENELYLPPIRDTEDLSLTLIEMYPELAHINFTIAIDRKVVFGKINIDIDHEVALLPPFSGG